MALLEIKNLVVEFQTASGPFRAVNGVSLAVDGIIVPEGLQAREAVGVGGRDRGDFGALGHHAARMRGLMTAYSTSTIRFTAITMRAMSSRPDCTTT